MVDPAREIVFGAIAGSLGKLIEFPFDTIKVRLQSAQLAPSTLAVIRHTLRHEGIVNGFYKGLKAPLAGACLESAVLFSAYEYAQSVFQQNTQIPHLALVRVCGSGAFAGFAAAFVLTPVELVKCNLQVANLQALTAQALYRSITTQIVQKHGVRGLWQGLASTVAREMAGTAVWFASYEETQAYLAQSGSRPWHPLAAGAVAGVLFNLLIYPVDTVKLNIQTAHVSGQHSDGRFFRVARTLVARPGGIRNLYNGLAITLTRLVPANAVIFYTYEWMKATF